MKTVQQASKLLTKATFQSIGEQTNGIEPSIHWVLMTTSGVLEISQIWRVRENIAVVSYFRNMGYSLSEVREKEEEAITA